MFRTSVKADLGKVFKKAISIKFPMFQSETGTMSVLQQHRNLPLQPVPAVNKSKKTIFTGDYQTPLAIQLGNQFKIAPSEFAKQLSEEVLSDNENNVIEKFEIINNGILSLSLKEEYVKSKLGEIFREEQYHQNGEKIKVIVDFSSPNMAKRMHVGHLRSTIIGDCICRILERDGRFDVSRINHVGDFGTQFGMLLAYIETNKIDLSKLKDLSPSQQLETVESYYKESKKCFDNDDNFKSLAHKKVIALQQGSDMSVQDIWKYLLECSRYEFDSIYERLQIKLEEKGESFYKQFIPTVLNLVSPLIKDSQGARCIFTSENVSQEEEDQDPPLMVQKADGGYTYDTTDLATLWYRLYETKSKWLIYVTDVGQASHFQKVFKVGEMMNWIDPLESSKDIIWSEDIQALNKTKKVRIDHVGFGVVLDENKKKFKTRSGETVKLHDLLDEAVKRAYKIMKDKGKFYILSKC